MKQLKMLGLAALAVAGLMAFAATSAAFAEETAVLCKANEDPCSKENTYGAGTTIHAVLKEESAAVLKAGIFTVECTESTVHGDTDTVDTPEGDIDVLSFGECDATVTVEEPGHLQIHHEGEGNGNLTASGVKVKVVKFGTTCYYGGEVSSGLTLTGGSPATLDANAEIERLPGSSIFCASTASWTAHYEVTEPDPLYVSTTP